MKSYSRRIDHDRDAFFDGLGFVRPEQAPWILPSEPSKPLKEWEASTETGSLLHELTRYFNTFVRFPSGVFAETCAVWTLASAIPERVTYAPPLAYVGHEDTMRLACCTTVHGDIEVETGPEVSLFGENFFS